MLKKIVKASSVSNLTDARYFAAWHVDWLGFDLTLQGLNVLPLQEVKEIKDWIEGPKTVGEIDLLDVSDSQQLIDYLALAYIQVGMNTPIEYLKSINVSSIIMEVIIEPTTTYKELERYLDLYFDYVDYYMLDFEKNKLDWTWLENNNKFNKEQLKAICQRYDLFLNINFEPTNIEAIIERLAPYGICLKGGVEEKTGFKSFEELDNLLELLEEN